MPNSSKKATDTGNQSGSDMQMESDEDTEGQIDIDVEEELDDDIEGDEDGEAEAEDDADGDADDEPLEVDEPQTSKNAQPKLKITLKLPTNAGSSAGTATPEDPEVDFAAFKRTPKRRAKTKVIHDDIESEDPTSPEDSDSEEEENQSTQGGPGPSRSAGTSAGGGGTSTSARPLTTRQAVLASMVDPTHVSLNEASKSKKQPLNETELALRREETARKRKNLSEKRLEDEKAETINRLLKKQSRPRNKRTNTTDSPVPASGARTPKVKLKSSEDAEDAEGEEWDEEAMDVVGYQEHVKPTMYRWVSSLRNVPAAVEGGDKTIQLLLTLSVPESVLSVPPSKLDNFASHSQGGVGVLGTSSSSSSKMEVDSDAVPPTLDPELERIRATRGPGVCAVAGCGLPRKYRSVKDWTIGACGSEHLRVVAG